MSKDELFKQIESMPDSEVKEMMESKKSIVFSISELMDISTALATYLDTPMGLMMEVMSNGELNKLKERIDSKITIRLGTYGIFMDDLEVE